MRRSVRFLVHAVLTLTLGLFLARPAAAASLQPVSNWGASGVPSYVAMYIYVPDRLATNPPVLVVSHFCGGDAAGVFGEAQGGGIVAAADQFGFIMIFPQNHLPGTTRNCWDVGTPASLTHDGGGDTQAIAQMVRYTITTYNANANRVYAVGTSSGAMMTEALLAVYPDVFKAGAEFAGVPAGCWAASYSATDQWSGPCAGGQVTHTPQEWGDLVRNMDRGYAGYRPRIQLWHGLADMIISPTNHSEAIKEWTNVLGLPAAPTSTTTVSLAAHQWTRQTWNDSCGLAVLDAWAETGGPHGTDANLNAQYVIPFLGLDRAGAVDPVVAACPGGGGGGGGSGGSGGSGGISGGSGGRPGTGGATSPGGSSGSGARTGGSGTIATGGTPASGGAPSTGSGGTSSTGGAGTSGTAGTGPGESPTNGGCSCAIGGGESVRCGYGAAVFAVGLLLIRRRRRTQKTHPERFSR